MAGLNSTLFNKQMGGSFLSELAVPGGLFLANQMTKRRLNKNKKRSFKKRTNKKRSSKRRRN
jgi:hypothetical protein